MATTITANGINFPDGSEGSPSIGGTDTNTGLFTGSDIIGFSTGGSERLRIDASGNINIANDSGKLQLGTSADLKFYHDGSSSFIQHTNTSSGNNLLVESDTKVIFRKITGSEKLAQFNVDGAVELYYDNSKKLHTQSAGVNVEGQIVIDHTAGTDGKGEIAFGESGRPFIDGFDNGNHGSGAGFDFRAGNGDYFIKARQDAAVEIYHDNTKRLETTSSGTLFPAGTADFRGPSGTSYTVEVNPTYVNPYGLWCREPSSFNNGYPLLAVTNNGGQTYFRTLSGGTSEARNIQPVANNTYDLGTSSVRWRNIYTNDLNLSNEGSANDVDGTWGDWTLQEGESDLFLKNNRSGKKYKFNLTEVS